MVLYNRDVPVSCSQSLSVVDHPINLQLGSTINNHVPHDVDDVSNVLIHLSVSQPQETPYGHGDQQPRLSDSSNIQVEFPRVMLISGILTQGSPTSISRVTHFQVKYSTDCAQFVPLHNKKGEIAEFAGNLFANTTITVLFDQVFTARCVQVVPTQRVGDETVMRFEFLGCDVDVCHSSISPNEITGEELKKFVFDKEKIISGLTINLDSAASNGSAAFILGYSRTCNFDTNGQIIKQNGSTEIYIIPEGQSSLTIEGAPFPLRTQCFAIVSPEEDLMTSHVPPLRRVEQYTVHFEGCDALHEHDALDGCGKSHFSDSNQHLHRRKRVVGGTPSIPGQWPWLVSLHFLGTHTYTTRSGLRHLCGGSLIHPQWVITAAHCVDEVVGEGLSDKNLWLASLGEHLQGEEDGTEQIIDIVEIVKHPGFTFTYNAKILFDIALMKLSKPVNLSDYVNLICLEPNYTVPDHTPCITAGWGLTENDGAGVEIPHHATLQILPLSVCADRYNMLDAGHPARMAVSIEESVICAVAEENGTDSCMGDSGGPLVCYHDDHWVQVGIVSVGMECGDLRYPGIYTRINHYYEWIQQVTSGH